MDNPKQMLQRQNCISNGKEDDDVSVIAIIEKEDDRSSRQQSERPSEKQERPEETVAEEYRNLELLPKLPLGRFNIKQDKKYKDDSDYVRDSTETSSGGSSSGSGVAKVRRVRTVRKTRSAAEVRRNPVRAKKKDPDKNFPRLRQRLLSAKRKEMLFDPEPSKRGKSSTKPYMNTRSVTRKMYNVGATYQAPTMKDALEWKEWPVHGMHERPVFHPQLGLAAEYLGRYFTSFDGLSYCEIIDRPEVEVVSVDPLRDSLPSFYEKRRGKIKTKSSTNVKPKNSSEKKKSFENCMHESFHCVLGYCSQVMTPTYKNTVEEKLDMLNENKTCTIVKETQQPASAVENSPISKSPNNSKENIQKSQESKAADSYTAVVIPQNVKNFNQIPKTQLFPAHKVYLANTQKSIAFSNVRTLQGGQMKIQEVIRPSKNPFILVNTDTKDTRFLKSASSNVKPADTQVLEENLGELSSIYKHFDLSEQMSSKKTPPKREKKVEFAMTRYLLNTAKQTKIQIPNVGEGNLYCEVPKKGQGQGVNKTCYTNEASEIAKILSEYNKNTAKKSAPENTPFCSVKNIRVNELCNKDENTNQNSPERNRNISFPQGKWRRFHLTMGKPKDLKSNATDQRFLSGIQNRQSLFRINPTGLDSTPGRMIEVSKHVETLQRNQTTTNAEKKESTSTVNDDADSTGTKAQYLQDLLEDTAMLYCAATGTHQDDLATYIDTLDAVQSVQWLDTCKNPSR
ncbi:uncharacterized protein LOC105661748 [Megachile rotundata]|uniref:uncharacterized protein LOC105661748 n=1 Tax=Megachile rotundata TaxID=143995 RepID=UPI003FD28C45